MPYVVDNDALFLVKRNRIIELLANLIQAKIDKLRTEPNHEKIKEMEETILKYISKLEEV